MVSTSHFHPVFSYSTEPNSLPDLHPCEAPCHAPASCMEDTPCQSLIALSCPCGRIRQSVLCNRSTSNPAGRNEAQQQPKCNTECGIAKRNARLADALGISPESKGGPAVNYPEDLISFARVNPKLLSLVEKALSEYVSSILAVIFGI